MYTVVIYADPSAPAEQPGNKMVVQVELVPGTTIRDPAQIAMSLTMNTGHQAGSLDNGDGTVVDIHDEPDTEIYFQMSLEKAEGLANGIKDMILQNDSERVQTLVQALEFKSAQLSCVKGAVGAIVITKNGDSERGAATGFGFYDLDYLDDQAEQELLHSVKNIECYVPFIEDEQYEWLRALVGGNHQYTSSIQVTLVGFTLEEVRDDFLASLQRTTKQEPTDV